MPELLVVLGAEASIFVFVAAMTLHARRMDVLSGRFFATPAALPTVGGDLSGPPRGICSNLTRSRSHVARMMLLILRRLRWSLRMRPRLPSWFVARPAG